MTDFSDSTLGVTGAAGHLGRGVLTELKARGARRIVAITRDPGKLSGIGGIDIRRGDFDDSASLDLAFAGIDRLLVISTDGGLGVRIGQHSAAIDAAERAGVAHLVYTGLTNPYPSAVAAIADDHFWTEARLARFSGDWTVLRVNIYMEMVLGAAALAMSSGQIVHAAGMGGRAYVARADAAAAAAGALLKATGRSIEDITGREVVTQTEVAAALGAAAGRPLEAVDVGRAALVDGMVAGGLPRPLAEAFASFDLDTARGVFAVTSDAVKRLTGREPVTLAQFLAAHPLNAAA
jgi:NAD(P)H dehydrogenase (quinone)